MTGRGRLVLAHHLVGDDRRLVLAGDGLPLRVDAWSPTPLPGAPPRRLVRLEGQLEQSGHRVRLTLTPAEAQLLAEEILLACRAIAEGT